MHNMSTVESSQWSSGAECGRSVVRSLVGSSQRLKKYAPAASLVSVHHLRPIEQGWLAQCLSKVPGWGIMFICGMVLRCAGTINAGLSLDQL